MTDTQVVERERETVQETQAPATDMVYIPCVDICEDGGRLRLLADMPGADQKSVNVSVENNVLTIEGKADLDAPEGCEQVGREYEAGRYRRDFTLSDAFDSEGIKARMRHGVLEVTIPKREEHQPKRRAVKIESD